ncbi:SDR family oxidoreductase [Actinomadura sp. BRA 177]|uniref:SDR family NAD(P)-dependent oxidoreductase n=1 Tax=Actinomadura sp. BRA 177 TaxID=2745202 RepID=UPI001595552E|nr:SDR family oxidoreductase [Actinomadura sp. BRA 177]NVI91244.1 SDR family oxidoreductase [Actinomadura sp. BRA 177]
MTRALVLGANGQIGRAIAAELAQAGLALMVAARNAEGLKALTADLRASGAKVDAFALDVRDAAAVAELVDRSDGLSVAVNNIGMAQPIAPLDRLDLDDLDQVLAVNLRGVAVAMKYELAALPDGGCIVNVASSAGLRGVGGMAAYAAAKHGVIGLTRSAALEQAGRGVRVNAVAPGTTESGGTLDLPAAMREQIGSGLPMGRIGRAEELARAVAWLASPAASYVNGTVLSVDGGQTAG